MGMVKTGKEIRLFKKAASISNSCIKVIKKSLKGNITERELARRVRKEIKRNGATLSFQTLVGSGDRSGMVHTKPHVTDRRISGLGYIDFGARYKGYCSDVTVPFVKGKLSPQQKKIVKLVLDAYKLSVRSVKVGMPCWQLHHIADRYLRKRGYKMAHALGHGLGKKVHSHPLIVVPSRPLRGKRKRRWERIKKITFKPGMVFTIEPGVYTKKFGCRIENDFLLQKNRLVRLTDAELLIV